jgi:hypothetical protein
MTLPNLLFLSWDGDEARCVYDLCFRDIVTFAGRRAKTGGFCSDSQPGKMAFCLRIEASYPAPPTAADVAKTFAKHDIFLKHMSVVCHHPDDGDEVEAMTPGDDYYTAPFALAPMRMPKRRGEDGEPPTFWWLVFGAYKCRSAHREAIAKLKAGGVGGGMLAHGSLADALQCGLGPRRIPENRVVYFKRYGNTDDTTCLKLEDYAFEQTCKAIGVEAPADWRALRAAAFAAMGGEAVPGALFELPEWGEADFRPLTPAEARQAAKERRERAEEEARLLAERREETKRLADAERVERYGSAVEKYKGAAVPDDALCVVVMDTGPAGEPNFKCPYDRKDGSPFCSMCEAVIARAAA